MNQFDIDQHSPYVEMFNTVRNLALSLDQNVYEKKNPKQTSYFVDDHCILTLKTTQTGIAITVCQGAKLAERYSILRGNGKVVRNIHFHENETIDTALLKEIFGETIVVTYEKEAIKALKSKKRG
jgi:hypothetical protein